MPNFNQVTKKEVKVREREVQLTQAELAEIKIITKEEASELIEDRLPIGLFMIKEQQVYVGIDNTTGEAWTEEFEEQEACIKWLTKVENDCEDTWKMDGTRKFDGSSTFEGAVDKSSPDNLDNVRKECTSSKDEKYPTMEELKKKQGGYK